MTRSITEFFPAPDGPQVHPHHPPAEALRRMDNSTIVNEGELGGCARQVRANDAQAAAKQERVLLPQADRSIRVAGSAGAGRGELRNAMTPIALVPASGQDQDECRDEGAGHHPPVGVGQKVASQRVLPRSWSQNRPYTVPSAFGILT